MTTVSLHSDRQGYKLDGCELALCVVSGFTATPYAVRHFAQTCDADEGKWAHLTKAARLEEYRMVEILLDCDANPNGLGQGTPLSEIIKNGTASRSLIQKFLQHPEATLHFSGDQPDPPLSDAECTQLFATYRAIEMSLQEGLTLVIAHTDVHSIISGYYWRV